MTIIALQAYSADAKKAEQLIGSGHRDTMNKFLKRKIDREAILSS